MADLVIRGATIVDGTGAPARTGDVAVKDGVLTEVGGKVGDTGNRELNGDGLLLAPGWVDIHTHYDGQVTWDPEVTPSSWHGATTVVMGNCGVGFAPVRPDGKDFLIELMESVEDIPGTALHEGIPWGWETFGQYLDAIDTPYALDVGAQVPHVALREEPSATTGQCVPTKLVGMQRLQWMQRDGVPESAAMRFTRSGSRSRARAIATNSKPSVMARSIEERSVMPPSRTIGRPTARRTRSASSIR